MTVEHLAKAADACVSLAYKYSSLRGCVLDQRPELLGDPLLATINMQIEALTLAFDSRVRSLAEGAD
jgi:hypothetical protein